MRSLSIAAVAGATLVAAVGAVAPAHADTKPAPNFSNCEDARNAGWGNIPKSNPYYGNYRDTDGDGYACDNGSVAGFITPFGTFPLGGGSYPNCDAARAAGKSNIPAGLPGYDKTLDRDSDGWACESNGDDKAADAPAPAPKPEPKPEPAPKPAPAPEPAPAPAPAPEPAPVEDGPEVDTGWTAQTDPAVGYAGAALLTAGATLFVAGRRRSNA